MTLENRFIAIPSTKLTLKEFLTDKLLYFLVVAGFNSFVSVICHLSLAAF